MTHEDFEDLVNVRLNRCTVVLNSKREEYSDGKDRLHNFVAAGRIDDEDPAKALWGMWKKHIVSIADMVRKMEEDPDYVPSKETCAEKFGDNINYTLLLEGIVEDRRNSLEQV